jgi:hypothetical protein
MNKQITRITILTLMISFFSLACKNDKTQKVDFEVTEIMYVGDAELKLCKKGKLPKGEVLGLRLETELAQYYGFTNTVFDSCGTSNLHLTNPAYTTAIDPFKGGEIIESLESAEYIKISVVPIELGFDYKTQQLERLFGDK